ncbi:hypothetical protein TNCT_3201 [Trichonephila clavata]|uniref:Uncharacterized protein n=1 Tax=Trichonephila clavata TaxID=2740835 RepID=A0A8X6J3Z5_TRICU|nr:hypothetical protein TNCT_3201 [Trichonephila clavata]
MLDFKLPTMYNSAIVGFRCIVREVIKHGIIRFFYQFCLEGEHDAIVRKAIPSYLCVSNKKFSGVFQQLIPDLVLWCSDEETISVDFTVAFEDRYEYLAAARATKIHKYQPILEPLQAAGTSFLSSGLWIISRRARYNSHTEMVAIDVGDIVESTKTQSNVVVAAQAKLAKQMHLL